jgi:hypothetical protein
MKAAAAGALGVAVSALLGCGATDVVARVAKTSFAALVKASGQRVSLDSTENSWAIASPAGDQVFISPDFSRNNGSGKADMDKPDAEFSFDAKPFLDAGLNPDKLVGAENYAYEIEDGRLMLHFELGDQAFSKNAAASIDGAFSEIVRTQRDRIGYHEKLDHYGIKLGGGNMLEWAKDLSKNDKDLVWVLNPGPFIAAGLDPAKVAGWAFAKVELKDDAGKTVLEDKLLKPFDLQ